MRPSSGETVVYSAVGADHSAWDTFGLLEYAKAHETAQVTASRLNGE